MKREAAHSRRAAITLACLLSASSLPSLAVADVDSSSELAAARDNFRLALELEKNGKYEEALEKLEATAKVRLTSRVRFHIGLCNEKLGRFGAAIRAYEAAMTQAETEGGGKEVLEVAATRAESLRADRPKLTVTFNKTPESLQVDGEDVDPKDATEYPVDPGPHVVIATRGGSEVRQEVTVAKAQHKTLALVFADGTAPTTAKPAYEHPAEKLAPSADAAGKPTSTRTLGVVVGGAGVVSLALAGTFYAVRMHALNELEGACTTDLHCPASAQSTRDRAKTFTTMSGVALGVGLAALGAGTVLLLTGKPMTDQPKPATARVVPYAPNANLFGFGIEGAF